MHKLSIIVPCYNCADTLEEAVDSIYVQKVSMPFDVTMVDDGSTDATYAVMQKLATRYPNIRLVRHERNQGGGATRNTAVECSDGEIIFCLDSDDVLGPELLERITQYWIEKRCDGVGISKSIKFNNTDIADICYITNFDYVSQRVPFESLLDGTQCSLYSTFLITRDAFHRCGGYPTAHGFDTQGMAFRFVANGLIAYPCPNTVYYHRVNYHDSYYLREELSGSINRNWFCIFEEVLYLFNDDVKKQILEHNLGQSPSDPDWTPILDIVYKKPDIYAGNYRECLALGVERAIAKMALTSDKFSEYCAGVLYYHRGNYSIALQHFSNALALGFNYSMIYIRILEASLKLSGRSQTAIQMLDILRSNVIPSPMKIPRLHKLKKRIARNRFLAPLVLWLIPVRNHLRGVVKI